MSNLSDGLLLKANMLRGKKKKTNHLLHLLLSLISGGVWVIVWVGVGLMNQHNNHYLGS